MKLEVTKNCKFCNKPLRVSCLKRHQIACEKNPNRIIPEKEKKWSNEKCLNNSCESLAIKNHPYCSHKCYSTHIIECEKCGEEVKAPIFSRHKKSLCIKSENYKNKKFNNCKKCDKKILPPKVYCNRICQKSHKKQCPFCLEWKPAAFGFGTHLTFCVERPENEFLCFVCHEIMYIDKSLYNIEEEGICICSEECFEKYKENKEKTNYASYNFSKDYVRKSNHYHGEYCYNCNIKHPIEVHHIIHGDRTYNAIANLIPLCSMCHSYLHHSHECTEKNDVMITILEHLDTIWKNHPEYFDKEKPLSHFAEILEKQFKLYEKTA